MIRTPRLIANRFGVFAVRILIPAAQSGTGRRKEIRHSLGTKNPVLARVLALQFNLHFEQARMATDKTSIQEITERITTPYRLDIQRGVMESEGEADHTRMMEAVRAYRDLHGTYPPIQEAMAYPKIQPFTPPQPKAYPKTLKLSQAAQQYLHEKRHSNTEGTLSEKKTAYGHFQTLAGDLELNHIDKEKVRQWKAQLDGQGNQSVVSINKKISFVADLFKWAIKNGHYHLATNPADGLRIEKSKSNASTPYLPLSNEDIGKIYGAGYRAYMSKPHHYWIPILGLFSGRRIEVLASLQTHQIMEVDGVWSIHVIKDKTKSSLGIVPIHPKVLELGFIEYVESLKAKGITKVFPDIGGKKNSKTPSTRFGEWLDQVGISDPLKVFHSLRHTAITRLHTKRGNAAHVMKLVGHDTGGSVHFGTYTHSIEPVELLETLKLLEYPTFNPS